MKIFFTGGSSKLGALVLQRLLDLPSVNHIDCSVFKKALLLSSPKLSSVKLDLTQPATHKLPQVSYDCLIHFAGLTHSLDPSRYDVVNRRATLHLAQHLHAQGCQNLVYVSTRCIGENAGAYGESKRLAEEALKQLKWKNLLILRPAEIYGADGNEGIDRMIKLAKKFHVVPLFFGNANIQFAPLHLNDFVELAVRAIISILNQANVNGGVKVIELSGPENLNGFALAFRIAKKYKALPIPVWLPALRVLAKCFEQTGFPIIAPDQIARLTGGKSTTSAPEDSPHLSIKLKPFC